MGRGAGYLQETAAAVSYSENWGLGFGASGTQPTGNASAKELAEYDAFYIGNADEKTIYLTFDCGYENGNTGAILDALKDNRVGNGMVLSSTAGKIQYTKFKNGARIRL